MGFFSSIRDKQVVRPRERTRGRERDVERQTIGGLIRGGSHDVGVDDAGVGVG